MDDLSKASFQDLLSVQDHIVACKLRNMRCRAFVLTWPVRPCKVGDIETGRLLSVTIIYCLISGRSINKD